MRCKGLSSAIDPISAVLLLTAAFSASAEPLDTALVGMVAAAPEGRMEGVLVSAKKQGSSLTVTVVSDAQGHYAFPAAKLDPGQYSLSIRAVGYELAAPVDNGTSPVTFWVGSNHGASVVKVEPLD